MTVKILQNYALGEWTESQGNLREIRSAVTNEVVAKTGSDGLDFVAMANYARQKGGPALRKMTFRERAIMVKALGLAVMERKEELYALNHHTGATRKDGWIDIEGGAGTFLSIASKSKRELPNDTVICDGPPEQISREGTFMAQHVYTSLRGVAVHINAFNFPVWGMMEKLAPTLIAGMPAIVKPATPTAYLAEHALRIMVETGLLPDGAVQMIAGTPGDLLDHLTGQDVVSFTGSAATASKLRTNPNIIRESVRFISEQDSLNASMLGPDATADSPEFDLFVKEVVREMTVKAGQKCTAIRRAMVPAALLEEAEKAIAARLAKTTLGDPENEAVRMGALVSQSQREDVREKVSVLAGEAQVVFGDTETASIIGDDAQAGAFISPILLRCDDPWSAKSVHEVEAFGPVSTLMPYKNFDDAVDLLNRGGGSLVMSLFTHDPHIAREVVANSGAFHGRIAIINRDNFKESTGHGSPLPVLVHGGPGRAGGGEEWAACAASNTICSAPLCKDRLLSSPGLPVHGLKTRRSMTANHIRSVSVSANWRSAKRSTQKSVRLRWRTLNISPNLLATIFMRTWIRPQRKQIRSFRDALPTAISSCLSPPVCSSIRRRGPFLQTTVSTNFAFSPPYRPAIL